MRTRDAAGGISFELQTRCLHRNRAPGRAANSARNQCSAALWRGSLLAMAANVYTLRQDRLEANARRSPREVNGSCRGGYPPCLQEALAAESDDRNVRNTCVWRFRASCNNPALASPQGRGNGAAFSRDGSLDRQCRRRRRSAPAPAPESTYRPVQPHAGPGGRGCGFRGWQLAGRVGRAGRFLRVWTAAASADRMRPRERTGLARCGHQPGRQAVVAIRESE